MRALFIALLALASATPAAAQDGRAAVERYGCASCHVVPGVRVSRRQSCVGCHERVVGAQRSGLGRAPRVEHYLHVPDLRHVTRRLREDYLVSYLQNPHDVRPRMEETMPRLPVTEADARLIVGFLRARAGEVEVPRSPAPSRSNVAAGRASFERAGCMTCHELGNLDFGVHLPPVALRRIGDAAFEAPNLRFVRDRMTPDVALAWIRDPRRLDPNTEMPHPQLSDEESLLIRDFLFLVEPGRPVSAPRTVNASALEPLGRPVRYAEVRRLFDRSCIHCHAHTDGQANATFGFAPSSLDLSSPDGVRAGVTLPDGTHRSVITPDDSGLPPLVWRLMRRHEEAARDVNGVLADPLAPAMAPPSDAPPGMPLGLPPLASEEIRLLYAWALQGAPD